jgi:polysaccharide biosynthesis protein VpsQ
MRYLAYLAIATFFTISALVSMHKEWFGFIYGIPGKDQFAHFIGMGLLSFFMVLGFSSRATRVRPLGPLASMAAATLLVTLDEVSQLAIASRTFSLDDLAWSFAGVLVFGLAATVVQWIVRRHRVTREL